MALPASTLPLDHYLRYGRQMILDGFGLSGQLKLQQASVVVVGAGGLGCPALQYLAAAGIGRIRIIDPDIVEISNLHRQILHNERALGMYKAESAAQALKSLSSHLEVDSIVSLLTAQNAVSLLSPYDIILDCTDNAPTRYLLSDTAVMLGKPLVSGAAQKLEGQLCTYNLGADGPCYRCLFPRPPARQLAGTCEETGILGVVTGIIGNLQALETIKIIVGLHDTKPSLLLFSALGYPPFRHVKLRSRKPTCPACGTGGQSLSQITSFDYVQFCGGENPDWEQRGLIRGDPEHRIDAKKFKTVLESTNKATIIDVRPRTEFAICQLPGSINIPLDDLVANPFAFPLSSMEIYVVCRLGNDSQIAVDALRGTHNGTTVPGRVIVKDLIGGLRAWARDVDNTFPVY